MMWRWYVLQCLTHDLCIHYKLHYTLQWMYVTCYIITIIKQVTIQDLKWKILSHPTLMTFSRNLHLRYQSMQEIEMPRKCCFSPLEEELGRGALIKQKFNYLLSIRNFRREKCIGLDGGRRRKPIMITFWPKHTLKVGPWSRYRCQAQVRWRS